MKITDIITEGVAGPEKCWPGHKKVGTKPGTGKNKGKRVNDCEKIKEGADERKQNALWAQITQHEKAAKATKNDIKKQHHMKMADELRSKLKTRDVAESGYDDVARTRGRSPSHFPSTMNSSGWNEPAWSFQEIAQKLGIPVSALNLIAFNRIGGFPEAIQGVKSRYGSKKYYNRSAVKRWVIDNQVREKLKAGLAEDYNDDEQDDGFYVAISNEEDGVFIGALTKDGGKWRESTYQGTPPRNWGGGYMSYLTPQDIMQHLHQDYGRYYEVVGPLDEEEVGDYIDMMSEGEVVDFPKKHKGDLEDVHDCVKCGGDLQGGTYMGHKVKVCIPCKQVYLPPNSGIDQKGNKINEYEVNEDWQKANRRDKTAGMSKKAVKAYRRENPGSKLQTAVTTKPSKLKPGSKAAKRRKSFCARMSGNKGPMKDEKGRPTPKAKALRRWNCEQLTLLK